MCKGLAIIANKDGKVICLGLASHDQTKQDIPDNEWDSWLDYEWIVGVGLVCDLQGDRAAFHDKGLLTEEGKPEAHITKAVEQWVKDNEGQVYKWVEEGGLYAGQKRGDLCQQGSTIKGNLCQWDSTIEGNLNQEACTIKGDLWQWDSTIEGRLCQWGSTIKGNLCQWDSTIEGNLWQWDSTIEGNLNQEACTIKGDLRQEDSTIKGDLCQQDSTIEGQVDIGGLKQGDVEAQKVLDEYYKSEQGRCTLAGLIKWLVSRN